MMSEKFGVDWDKENAWCKYISEKYILAEVTPNGKEVPEAYYDTKVEAIMEFLKMGACDNLKVFRGTVVCKDICGEEVLISLRKKKMIMYFLHFVRDFKNYKERKFKISSLGVMKYYT